jgi:response regulator RpfG family c-di-GMP phosphodiesterase
MSVDDACAELQRGRGTQFDPDVVEAFMACRDRIEQAGRWDQVSADPARRTVDEPV